MSSEMATMLAETSEDVLNELMDELGVETQEELEEAILALQAQDAGIAPEDVDEVREGGPWTIHRHVGGDEVEGALLADWFLQKRARLMAQAEQVQAMCAARIEQYKRFEQARCEAIMREVGGLEWVLERYYSDFNLKGTCTLPNGKLRMAKQRAKTVWNDEEALNWAQDNCPDAIKQTVSKSALKGALTKAGNAYADENGEVVPFVHMEEPEEPYLFKVE